MFFTELFRYIILVLIFGGLFSFASIFWRWVDTLYLIKTIGGWFAKQTYVFIKVYPPEKNESSIAEMESFFTKLSAIYAPKSAADKYVDGTWYDTYTFEFHAKDGKVQLYVRLNQNFLSLFQNTLEASFPGARIEQAPDPLENLPHYWNIKEGFENYKGYLGVELDYKGGEKLAGEANDIFTLKSWREFQPKDLDTIADPMSQFFSILRSLKPNNYVIVQYCLQPFARENLDAKIKEKWKEIFEKKIKPEFIKSNPITSVTDQASGAQMGAIITEQEKKVMDQISRKLASQIYKVKIRLNILSDNPSPKGIFGELMTFYETFGGDIVGLAPKAKTWLKDSGESMGVLGPWVAQITNQLFYKNQSDFYTMTMYRAMLERDMAKIAPSKHFSVENLAGLVHFPITNSTNINKDQFAEVLNQGFDHESSISLSSQAPTDLPS